MATDYEDYKQQHAAAQRTYHKRRRDRKAPRRDDLARELLRAAHGAYNDAQIVNISRSALLELATMAGKRLVKRGFAVDEVQKCLVRSLTPRTPKN